MARTYLHENRRVTAQAVQEFARQFSSVCEGQPRDNYPVLLRELMIQRCRVAAAGLKTLVLSAQAVCREVCIAMFAFQTPMIGVLEGPSIFDHMHDGRVKELLIEAVGGEDKVAATRLCVFDDLFLEQKGRLNDWSYVDAFTEADVMLLGLADTSEIVTMLMALTFSECGKRRNAIVYRGRKTDAKLRILFSPPRGPADDPAQWFYNKDGRTHYWIGGVSKTRNEMFLDGACFEYQPGRTTVYMWTGSDSRYEVEASETCDGVMATAILDRLKEMMKGVQFDIMETWDI